MNRATFFASVRMSVFGGSLKRTQVAGIETIIDEFERRGLTDLRWAAYILGTTFHESARTMEPITERGKRSYFRKYDGRADLGNTEPDDGYRFRGRGFVQITGRANYAKMSPFAGVDLVADPDQALEPEVAVKVMFDGMLGGLFTGKSLTDYFSTRTLWVEARRIVNGKDRASLIAGYARSFHAALKAAA